jgi:hypothetical protein
MHSYKRSCQRSPMGLLPPTGMESLCSEILGQSGFSAMRATRPLANHWTSSSRNGCENAIGKAISMSWRVVRADTAMATSSRFQG